MNKLTNPLDYVLNCCEQGLVPDKFDVLNARDELNRLKKQKTDLYEVVAWARVNNRGDLHDPRLCCNPYVDQRTVLPLYSNRKEFKNLIDELKNA
jgi:hypothetical protein